MTNYVYGSYTLRNYQAEAYESIAHHLRNLSRFNDSPKESLLGAFVEASVGAGKTSIMGAVCDRFVKMGWPVLCMARDLKLVEQNAETFWDMEIKNSIYSAAYTKAMHYKDNGVIVSNEATAYRALFGKGWKDYTPRAVLVDECHQVGVDDEECQYMKILLELNRRCIEKYGHRVVLIGFTGSPYRHTTSIIGDIWKESLYQIDTATLVGMGFLVPTIFGAEVGHDKSLDYDLSEFGLKGELGTSDFSAVDMANMESAMIADGDKLKLICDEVIRLTKDRNAVMITCAGHKHMQEVMKYLPADSAVMVHSGQKKSVNDANIKKIENREAKFLLQVGCLTTGFDCPIIDTSVILRRIASLTLLTQLLGRGMRLLKDWMKDIGITKDDHLVLDYSGTMDEMSALYENPILDEMIAKEDKAQQKDTQPCPTCEAENSLTARRCIGRDKFGNRCEHFFSFIVCEDRRAPSGVLLSKGCGTQNDTRSRACRHCNEWLNNPSDNLNGKHYHDNDLIDVIEFSFGLTKAADKLLAQYKLKNGKTARQLFDISSKEKWRRGDWTKFINEHVVSDFTKRAMSSCRKPEKALEYASEVRAPIAITHRVNERGYDIVARKRFLEEA